MTDGPDDLTGILRSVAGGDQSRMPELMDGVYTDLKRLAAVQLKRERSNHTLQATALAHEAWMRLIDQRNVAWRDRAHFLAVASGMIRRILVDHARARHAARRGGPGRRIVGSEGLEGAASSLASEGIDLIDLDQALSELAEYSPVQARVVEMRFFGGLTIEEVAEVLGIGRRSVDREWACARAWLHRELAGDEEDRGNE